METVLSDLVRMGRRVAAYAEQDQGRGVNDLPDGGGQDLVGSRGCLDGSFTGLSRCPTQD